MSPGGDGRYSGGVTTDGRRSSDLRLRLARLEDLFRTPEPHMFTATGRLISGMDEAISTLMGSRIPRLVNLTILLDDEAAVADEAVITELIRRFCKLRLAELALRIRSQAGQQRHSLVVGLLLFVVGVGLASEFAAGYWPAEVKSLLGDGIFLVVAWVGLWYPLDYLVFGRRPLLQERKVLQALREADVRLERP
jgi:hypothetical protein